ncbi:MAG TPA: hypothetical protein VMN58_05400 [Acidimicrobiales bacterium]|nr:hypothetical protein [Acidimicrobiales bacterium]
MAQNDMLKRYLDAGVAFTQMTQRKAESIVKDLVATGEVQSGQTQARVQELLERSRENTERLLEQVRTEVREQVNALGLATTYDISRLRAEIADLKAAGGASPKKTAGKKASTKKTAGKKASAKKTAAKKTTAKKTTAKKAPAKKAGGATRRP